MIELNSSCMGFEEAIPQEFASGIDLFMEVLIVVQHRENINCIQAEKLSVFGFLIAVLFQSLE